MGQQPLGSILLALASTLAACSGDEGSGRRPVDVDFGEVVEQGSGRASADGGELQVGGALFKVPPGTLDSDTDLQLIQAKLPAGVPKAVLGDVYYLASEQRPRVAGPYTLELPVADGSADPGQLSVVAITNGAVVALRPVPASYDSTTERFVVDTPEVAVLTVHGDGSTAFGEDDDADSYAEPPHPHDPTGYAVTGDLTGIETTTPACSGSAKEGVWIEPVGAAFSILPQEAVDCELVNLIVDNLKHAKETYDVDFIDDKKVAPLAKLKPDSRLPVYLNSKTALGNDWSARGYYVPITWNSYIKYNSKKFAQDLRLNKPERIRQTVHHEVFHAVQDHYTCMWLVKPFGAMWWYDMTAEWAALTTTGRSFDEAVEKELALYTHALSVPMEDSPAPGLAYAQSLLVYHIEAKKAGAVREMLNGNSMRSAALRDEMIGAGALGETYPQYVQKTMKANLSIAGRGFWKWAELYEDETELRVQRQTATPGKGNKFKTETHKEDDKRYGEHRFTFDAPPLTTHFVSVAAGVTFSEAREVKIQLDGGEASQVLIARKSFDDPPTVQVSALSSYLNNTIKGLGTTNQQLLIGAYNKDPASKKRYTLTVQVQRPSLRDPFARCRQGEYEAAYDLFLEGVDIHTPRNSGDAYIMTATCAFTNGDYANAESLAKKGAAAHSGGGKAHALFIAEYAAERQGSDGSSHRDAGLEAAKESGECEDAGDACAENYRDNIRRILEQKEKTD